MGCCKAAALAAVLGVVAASGLAQNVGVRPSAGSIAQTQEAQAEPVHRWAVPNVEFLESGGVSAGGEVFATVEDYVQSDIFREHGMRCPVNPTEQDLLLADAMLRSPSDCSASFTSIEPEYDPANGAMLRIPVVVHVIQRTNGQGFIPESRVRSQIDILNEDFLAIPGTNGAPGAFAGIEFFLATEDPAGNPTTGITYSTNNTWYNDGGSYWNSLAWDPNRYMNIYTNSASGNLGYVPFLPQTNPSGIGLNSDRVVVLDSSFGRNAPIANYDLGRTATHEVGHYLGLYHTFNGGCGGGNCYTSGARVCDTNAESSPFFGCSGGRTTCGSPDPIDNYMDYSYDICMNKFTPEQVNRMRCTLFNYRQNLYQIAVTGPCSPADATTDGEANGEPDGAVTLSDFSFYLTLWSASDAAADITTTGVCAPVAGGGDGVDLSDFACYLAVWSDGCP